MHASISFLCIFPSLAFSFLLLSRNLHPSCLGTSLPYFMFAPLPLVFSILPHALPTNDNLFEHAYLMLHYNNNYDLFCSHHDPKMLKSWH